MKNKMLVNQLRKIFFYTLLPAIFIFSGCGGDSYRSSLPQYNVEIELHLTNGNIITKNYILDEKSLNTLHISNIESGNLVFPSFHPALVRCKALNSWSSSSCKWILKNYVIDFKILNTEIIKG